MNENSVGGAPKRHNTYAYSELSLNMIPDVPVAPNE